jgi:hypothetical protein
LDGDAVQVQGWAFTEFVGVDRVEVLVDGLVRSQARYGLPAPQVQGQWPMSEDPGHPNVGFTAEIMLRDLARGVHRLAVRVTDREGRARDLALQTFERP